MVICAALVSLPRLWVAGAGLVIIALHNTLDGVHLEGALEVPWAVLHERAAFEPWPGHRILVGYPLVPWVGVMMLGMGLGTLWSRPREERRRWLVRAGLGAIALFVVLRATNLYGDPEPWSAQPSAALTVASFLDCEKYPPSLLYLLMTLGPLALLLAALDRDALPRALVVPLETFGRVPLFFYLAHLYLLRPPSIALGIARWGDFAGLVEHRGSPELPLGFTYLAWALTIAVLFPLSRWYGALKQRRARDWPWLRYL
jgi:uncharacterized membrane protein